jgi:hypothetical protein
MVIYLLFLNLSSSYDPLLPPSLTGALYASYPVVYISTLGLLKWLRL